MKQIQKKLYDSSQIDWNNRMFSNTDLRKLLIPLIVEQMLNSCMGMADTMMVSKVGSAAISAVSLVDAINNLVIQIFAALAAGATIICAQYLGRKDRESSNRAAQQIVFAVLIISSFLSAICLAMYHPILKLVFGQVEAEVMRASEIYFLITVLSFPFIALFNVGSSLYRAAGNSRFPMKISVISNGLNIIGNMVLIFGFQMGVAGAAASTLISRIFCALVVFAFLRQKKQPIVIRHYLRVKPDFRLIGRIFSIGVPAGIENGMFQFGKLAIQSSVSTLGTLAIAAQAMAIIMENITSLVGVGIGIGLMTIVGQTIGAGRTEEAKYYIVMLSGISEIGILVSSLLMLVLCNPINRISGMNPESAAMCYQMMCAITIVKPLAWVLSFVPSYGLKAAGDVTFSMTVSSLTMWLCRVLLCVYLIRFQGFGPMAVWIGMFADWTARAILFSGRFLSGKWTNAKVI